MIRYTIELHMTEWRDGAEGALLEIVTLLDVGEVPGVFSATEAKQAAQRLMDNVKQALGTILPTGGMVS